MATPQNHLEGISAVAADWDDTFVSTMRPKIAQNIFTASKYYGIELTEKEVIREWSHNSFPDLVKKLFKTDDFDAAMVHIRRHYDEYPKEMFPTTIPTVNELGRRGLWLGVLTSLSSELLQLDAKNMSFPLEKMDFVQTAEDTKVHKPNPLVFGPTLAALRKSGITDLQRVLYIGDALSDMNAAGDAGIRFVGITQGAVSAEEFADHGAVSINNIGELIA